MNVLLSIKIDKKIKQELQSFAAELGISSTALVNLVVRQTLRDRRIVLDTELEPTPYLEEVMRAADADIKNGKNLSPVFNSVDDMFDHLTKTA